MADEIANAAFWIGTMNGFSEAYPDITQKLDFDDAKANFLKAAKLGHGTKYNWTGDKLISDQELIEKELLPIARAGLKKANVNSEDIDKYLGIIEERNRLGRTGARWMVESYGKLMKEGSREEASTALVAAIYHQQKDDGKPIHEWKLAHADSIVDWTPSSLLVEEFMTTDIFTVSKEDIPELAADMMDWQQIRYLPIENSLGELIGLLTVRGLLRHFSSKCRDRHEQDKRIGELMIKKPITIHPEATVLEAMDIMSQNKIGCLPVVTNKKLVGMITEANFVKITSSLLKRLQRNKKKTKRSLTGEHKA